MSKFLRIFLSLRLLVVLALALCAPAFSVAPALAQNAQVGTASGLPIPRFVSMRNAPTNVRVGPGTNYDIAFTFLRPGVPVEITAEFDTWRRIRDVEGDEGWVHQNLVVGDRTALVAPWQAEGPIALRVAAGPESAVRAWLSPNMLVSVRTCTGTACEIRLSHTGPDGHATTYQGFVAQETLWGVYEGEVFD
ncbi:SH3 domain-containing protein [Pelagibacterium halotolerans]|nr:SH3 domain-containing protein [Pelagibacterium halotolerans]QJR20380.1 SH3 domain-containing protein [Pelagibacterium halotolerans]SEA60316.1 SH3-like domain-containing protein [Pelagibacterium halotolerans]